MGRLLCGEVVPTSRGTQVATVGKQGQGKRRGRRGRKQKIWEPPHDGAARCIYPLAQHHRIEEHELTRHSSCPYLGSSLPNYWRSTHGWSNHFICDL